MKNPPRDVQTKHLMPKILYLDEEIKKVYTALRNFPIQTSSFQEIESALNKSNLNFIDLDFPPIETSAYRYWIIFIDDMILYNFYVV